MSCPRLSASWHQVQSVNAAIRQISITLVMSHMPGASKRWLSEKKSKGELRLRLGIIAGTELLKDGRVLQNMWDLKPT